MIQICRAEDGQVFKSNSALRDIERAGTLETFLSQETGIEEEAILAYLPDGRRLVNANLRELAGSREQLIYVFNKYYLDYEPEEVIAELRLEAPLQPPIEENISATPPFKPSQLGASFLHTAHLHHEHIERIYLTMHYQYEGIRIASTAFDLNLLPINDTFDGLASIARRELEKQNVMLAGIEADLELISRVKIHPEFLSAQARKAIEAGDRPRMLGDYVSNTKMKQVADGCNRIHGDQLARLQQIETTIIQLKEGSDSARSLVGNVKILEDAEACKRRATEIVDQISNKVSVLDGQVQDTEILIHELRQLDNVLRQEVQVITEAKNSYTRHCVNVLRHISSLNNGMVQLPALLNTLQTSFRGKNSFAHIQRLHNMLYAYGATVIEIVRRKEFSRFFYQRAQSILEVMAKFSASERKRRQLYRSELHGQLPFETRGMDDPVPTIDFSPTGSMEASYSLEREDVDGLLRVLDDLQQYSQSINDSAAVKAVQDCRVSLDKAISKMDSLETGFDKIAERSLLSASRLQMSRRRSIEADQQVYQEAIEELRAAQQSKAQMESVFQEERTTLRDDIRVLQERVKAAEASAKADKDRAERLERELRLARDDLDSESTTRRIVEERNADLHADIERQRDELSSALMNAGDQTDLIDNLRQELAQVRRDFEDVKALEARNSEKINTLLEEQAISLRRLEEARSRGEDLEAQIQAARQESSEVHTALKDASEEKDRLLRAQASEHDRIIRDHIAEADGDRAVLERQFFELKVVQENTERRVKDLRADLSLANAESSRLREQLHRVERDRREAQHVEALLRDDLKAGQLSRSDFEQQLEDARRLIAQILDVAISFRNSHVKALTTAQNMASHSNPSKQTNNLGDSVFSGGLRHSIIGQPEEPTPIDPSDPAMALEALRSFDHDHFLDAITKTGSTIRKWQKQCKEYRERAKGKISFRNFAKGDLALFLPTRNSVSKPWAAFNVSFPHYFLQATGHLAEQLKTREWIVARITSITERVVDQQDPTSNPYGLGEGVKYYMLEVEDWTQSGHGNKKRVSSRKVSNDKDVKEAVLSASPPQLPPGPPEAEVEESFQVTHPPNSALFPTRPRTNSSPTVRPSSLSKLLAQATADSVADTISPPATAATAAEFFTSSPPISPLPLLPPSPSHPTNVGPHPHLPGAPSPLRPGSRASRLSTTSRFSSTRLPALGATVTGSPISKAAPTTAITDHPMLASSPSSAGDGNPFGLPNTPSPDGSISDGMANALSSRRRTTSYHLPKTSPLAASSHVQSKGVEAVKPSLTASRTLANLASSLGFSRKKQSPSSTQESEALTPTAETPGDTEQDPNGDSSNAGTSASDLLKRF